ncbi:MAG: glycosyltransferase family 2 protein [Bacteroidota bacterium]
MDVSVIIVSYNTYTFTHEAVASAFSATKDLDIEVIVVDNNSPDESAPRLKAAFANQNLRLTIIENEENAGFSAANNQGAAIASGRHLFFLNPDTIVHEGAINALAEFIAQHPKAGAVGPHVLNTDGTNQVSVAYFTSGWRILKHHLPFLNVFDGSAAERYPQKTKPVEVVKGCAIMIHRDTLKAVGGWDERYFMYSEETELCLALHNAGYTNYFIKEACITHHGGQSSMAYYAEQQVVQQRSALQFLRRHHGLTTRMIHRISGLIGFGARALIFPIAAILRPSQAAGYKLRGEAASRLFRWFLIEYA